MGGPDVNRHGAGLATCKSPPGPSSMEVRWSGPGPLRGRSGPSWSGPERLRTGSRPDQSGSERLRRGWDLLACRSELQHGGCVLLPTHRGPGPVLFRTSSMQFWTPPESIRTAAEQCRTAADRIQCRVDAVPDCSEADVFLSRADRNRCIAERIRGEGGAVRTRRTPRRARAAPTPAGTSCGSARRHRAPSLRLRCRRHAR